MRDIITREGPGVFDPSNLGRIDDLFREAGSDVYEHMGPLLGDVIMWWWFDTFKGPAQQYHMYDSTDISSVTTPVSLLL